MSFFVWRLVIEKSEVIAVDHHVAAPENKTHGCQPSSNRLDSGQSDQFLADVPADMSRRLDGRRFADCRRGVAQALWKKSLVPDASAIPVQPIAQQAQRKSR